MATNRISLAAARGNFLSWCISGYLPMGELCRPLYFAQMIDGAEGEVGQFYPIYATREAERLFGSGSIAHLMTVQHMCTCPELPLYIAPVADPVGGVRAVHTITINGPATDHGILSMSVIDEQFSVGVVAGSTGDNIASALAGVLQRWHQLPFDVTVATNVVTLTARNAGMEGNWFVPEWNTGFGEDFPQGISVEIDTPTPGVGMINIEDALPVLACQFDCIATGFEDEAAINRILAAVRLNWRCVTQGDFKGGHVFHTRTATDGLIFAYGMNRNNPEETVIPNKPGYKYPSYLLAASFASRTCCTACIDPSRPVQYDNGVLGCLFDSGFCTYLWSQETKRMFWDAGIANWDIANTRGYRMTSLWIEEPLTTYKWDPITGAPDGAWQRMESRYTVTKFVRDLGNWYRRHYASVSLVNDGFPIPPGKKAVNPRIFQASLMAWFVNTQLGWTAELAPFPMEQMIQVERTNQPNNCDPNRLNVLIDLDLVNQLARIATTIDVSPEFACIPAFVATQQAIGYNY